MPELAPPENLLNLQEQSIWEGEVACEGAIIAQRKAGVGLIRPSSDSAIAGSGLAESETGFRAIQG